MKHFFSYMLFLWVQLSFGQSEMSLKDRLGDCAKRYENFVNALMASDTKLNPEVQPKFNQLFLSGAHTVHPFPNEKGNLTPSEYGLALASFTDNTVMSLEELRFCRSREYAGIWQIYAHQVFRGSYLPTREKVPEIDVVLSVREVESGDFKGEFRIEDIERMPDSLRHDPDSDDDGIPDRCDACVLLAGGLERDGAHPFKPCPKDSDGDGIIDKEDKCPNQYGEPEDNGCPNYTEAELEAIRKIQEVKRTGADSLSLGSWTYNWYLKRLPTVIKTLTGLRKLDLNQIEYLDLSILKDMTLLTNLMLYGNRINNLNELKKFKYLKVLDLNLNEINDISALNDLSQLTILRLPNGQVKDIRIIKNLTQLTELQLYDCEFCDLSALKNFNKLIILHLCCDNPPEQENILKNFKQLRELRLGKFRNLSGLQELKQLKILDLSYDLTDLTVLKRLKDLKLLTELCLYSNEISDISSLKDLKLLTRLQLAANKISDISALKDLKQLTWLGLSSNQISDISSLKDLKLLTELNLYGNPIQNFNLDLTNLPNLTTLYLDKERIQNIPKEVLDKGIDAIRAYQAAQRK